jgi:hypothetical protein
MTILAKPISPELRRLLEQCIEKIKCLPDSAVLAADASAKYEAWALGLIRGLPVGEREYAEIKLRWYSEAAQRVASPQARVRQLLCEAQDARAKGRLN